MSESNHQHDADKALYHAAMKHVTPLGTSPQNPPMLQPKKQQPRQVIEQPPSTQYALWRSRELDTPVERDAPLHFAHSGVHCPAPNTVHIDQTLDLHQMTCDQAANATHACLLRAQNQAWRVIHIIHGKGKHAILKTALNHWLIHHPCVLGFYSAPQHHGGTGSVYVFIRQRNPL